MLSAASQLSIKGAIKSVLTWTGSKSSLPDPNDPAWQKSRDIFSVVVTPDRIPKFCIPSLEVAHFVVRADPAGYAKEQTWGLTTPAKTIKRPRSTRSNSEWCIKKGVLGQEMWRRRDSLCAADVLFTSEYWERAGEHSDPVTRAALSLPHLSKTTTPYGFLTLGESPSIRRKESLFFGYRSGEFRILLSQKKENPCPSQPPTSPLMTRHQSRRWGKPSTQNLWPVPHDKLFSQQTAASLHCIPSSGRCTNKGEKKRFRLLMKKHLPLVKRFRSNSASVDRLAMLSKRSMHSPVS